MKAFVETSDFHLWLQNKSKCPKCGAADKFILSGHDFVAVKAYLKCDKCKHLWDSVTLTSF
jgi:hypothetical protein